MGSLSLLITITGISSVLIGSIGLFYTTNIIIFILFSSLSHLGWSLISLSCYTLIDTGAPLIYIFYLFVYFITNILLLLLLDIFGRKLTNFVNSSFFSLSFLTRPFPFLSLALVISLFSLAG